MGRFLVLWLFCSNNAIDRPAPSSHDRPAPSSPDRLGLPAEMLWAWERPEMLGDLGGRAGVAWLAATVRLNGARVEPELRRQPLRVDAGTPLLPVVRIEARAPTLDGAQLAEAVQVIERVAGAGPRLQIDFEASRSQRDFLRRLLTELRARSPGRALSMTALASWCFDDDWLGDLPVDEVVPMMYRLGDERAALLGRLSRAGRFSAAACRTAVGLSDDVPERLPEGRRYHFAARAWDAESIRLALVRSSP